MYSELIVKGYLTPDIRSRVIDSDFGVSDCGPPVATSADCNSSCADGSEVCGWGDISAVESAGTSGRSTAPGGIEEASSVVVVAVVVAVVGWLPDFSSVLDAIVSGSGKVLEPASLPRAVDISGASFTAVVEMSLGMVAAVAIFIRWEYAVCVPFRQKDENVINVMHTHVNVNAARQERTGGK